MIPIDILNFRAVNKNTLRGFFTLVLPTFHLKILDCRYFVQGENRWFSFPQKEIKKEGQKSEYIPLVSITDQEFLRQLKETVVNSLKGHENEVSPSQQNASKHGQEFSSHPSTNSARAPF